MPEPFQYPYLVTQDTPAVALEIQANFDSLLAWINTNYVQKDDSPGFDVNIAAPLVSGLDNQVVQKSYVDSNVIPTGTILMWSTDTLPNPDNWEWCRGEPKSTTDPKYVPLFGVIGFSYGDPGGGEFNMPDLKAKFPLGANPGVIGVTDTGGTVNVAQHDHTASFSGDAMSLHDHGAGSYDVSIDHGHGDTFGVSTGGLEVHDLRNIIANGGWPNVDSGGNNGLLYGSNAFLDHGHTIASGPAAGDPTNNWNPVLSRLGATSAFNTFWNAEEVSFSITGSVTDINVSDRDVGGRSGDSSAGTPEGTVTVDSKGDDNDNRPPWLAVNYIIRL